MVTKYILSENNFKICHIIAFLITKILLVFNLKDKGSKTQRGLRPPLRRKKNKAGPQDKILDFNLDRTK